MIRCTAACVVVEVAGKLRYFYAGDPVPGLSDSDRDRLLAEGMLADTDEPESTPAPAKPVAKLTPAPVSGKRPAQVAPKSEWVAFAVSKGADEAEAESLTKAELIDLFGEA